MDNEKFLQIGTVVLLKNAKKRLMIVGFGASDSSKSGSKMYDYMGVLYPEGVISLDKNILFDHEQIDKIVALGFSDEEDKQFKIKLNSIMNNRQ